MKDSYETEQAKVLYLLNHLKKIDSRFNIESVSNLYKSKKQSDLRKYILMFKDDYISNFHMDYSELYSCYLGIIFMDKFGSDK